ncbi:MAG: insulinase family protein [Propionibacteriaceae bacterium]|jgi:predicted Zn-dependent peptidase|nr:insulinase family protein [Propionibacteriaceae bacterium]
MKPRPLTYELHRHTLANGLRVVVNPDPWTPVVAVNLWYDVGSAHEVAGRTGFAHLFEHLMFSGSAHVRAGEHLAALQALGGEVNATTSFDRTNYFETVPAGVAELALWYEADRLGSLLDAIDQATLDTEREVVKEEKRQRYDNVPYGDAFQFLVGLVFGPDHPYGHLPIGSMADLDAASVADVHDFFQTYYRPANAVLTLAGAVTADEGRALAETYFGGLPATPAPPRPDVAPLPPLAGLPRQTVTRAVPQHAVYCAWRVPPVGGTVAEALGLALSVLGDGLTARLYEALVRPGLADSVGTTDLELARGNSVAVAYATARDGVTPAALEEALVTAWQGFLDEGPAEAELQRAVARATRDWLSALAGLDTRADAFSEATLNFDDPGRVNTWLAELAEIDAAAVQAAARDWLDPAQRATLVFEKEAQ